MEVAFATTWVGGLKSGWPRLAKDSNLRIFRQQTRCIPCASSALPSGIRIAVSGGTGFIGRALVARLLQEPVEVVVLARDPIAARRKLRGTRARVVAFDASSGPLEPSVASELEAADAVVNLAGEPVDQGRWTPSRKNVLWNSRVVGTAMLARAVAKSTSFNGVFITASAVGYYGTSETKVFQEDSPGGDDFLAKLAAAWENAAWRHTRSSSNVRTVVFRIGVVLGEDGGALKKMTAAFKAFLGGPPGGGRQWFSWVHRDDIVELILQAIADKAWVGTYNATAPHPVRLSTFCTELGRVLSRPNWLHVPGFAVQAAVGSEAADLILAGQHVQSSRTVENGFRFKYATVGESLEAIL